MRVTIAIFILVFSCSAANHYIRSGQSGDGSAWDNALPNIPDPLVRGDTYYVASGNYSYYTFNTLAGTSLVTVKKATVADHGTSTGWDDSYAAGQAVFDSTGAAWAIYTSYLVIDGVTGSGNSGHGIRLNSTTTADSSSALLISTANYVTLKSLEINAGPAGSGNGAFTIWASQPARDHTYTNLYVHGGRSWINYTYGGTCSNIVIDHCYFSDCGSGSGALHSAGIVMSSVDNVTLRYSVLKNMLYTGSTTYIEPQGTAGDLFQIYGNVFWGESASEITSQGILAVTSTDVATDVRIYNNTIYGLHGSLPGVWGGNVAGSTVYVTNNLWQSCSTVPNFERCTEGSNIKNTGSASFQNTATGDFRLTAHTAPAGSNLGTSYNVDGYGTIRSTWDIGAYEYRPVGIRAPVKVKGNAKFK